MGAMHSNIEHILSKASVIPLLACILSGTTVKLVSSQREGILRDVLT